MTKIRYLYTSSLLFALATPPLIHAQGVLEEVIVTAQKREQNLQDVGISVTAYSGDQMAALGYTSTTDISAQTPSLSISQFHPSITNINIRGVSQNDFADHLEPPVAVYMDEAYVSAMGAAYMQMFDMERAEVLRGPQGTLFGRNATGGLLHFISRKPDQDFSSSVALTLAQYDQIKLEGAVGGALTDKSSARLAIATNKHDGYVKNSIGTDLRDTNTYAVRAQLLYEASDELELLFRINHSSDDSTGGGYAHSPATIGPDGLGVDIGRNETGTFFDFLGGTFTTCPGCDAYGYKESNDDPFRGSFDQEGNFDREITGANAKVSLALDHYTITSITDYLVMDKDYREDTEGSGILQLEYTTTQDFSQWSQEFRVSGETDNTRWITGFFYLEIESDNGAGLDPEDLGPFVGAPVGEVIYVSKHNTKLDTESLAVFAHLEYDIAPDWTLIGAVRYTEDDRAMDYVLQDNFGLRQEFNAQLFPDLADQSFENFSLKAQVDWRPIDDWLVYASYDRGHKSGNFSTPFIGPIEDFSTLPHDEEVLTSYEVGVKAALFDGLARLNVSAFHYDYEDYQASFFAGIVQSIRNLDATVDGAEIELVLNPTDRLEFLFGASFLDAETENVGMPDGSFQNRGMPNAPDVTFNGLARYSWPLQDGAIALQVDANYTDAFCFTVVCHPVEEEDSYWVGNGRITYTAADRKFSLAAFVKNITDEQYRAFGLDSSAIGFTQSAFGLPRWAGIELRYSWQ